MREAGVELGLGLGGCGAQQLALDALADRIPHLAVDRQLLVFGARRPARIWKAPVEALPGPEEHRAGFVGLVAHGDHLVEWLVEVPLEGLALLSRDVDAELSHRPDRKRMHARRLS